MKYKKYKTLVFDFKDIHMKCRLDSDLFDESDQAQALKILDHALRDFSIDKTFVEFEGGKYEKTFIDEECWNTLCELALKKRKTRHEQFILDEAYRLIAECYIEQLFKDTGWPVANMRFEADPDFIPNVTFRIDTAEEWRTYPGKWQTW